jgi:hypothetical protein
MLAACTCLPVVPYISTYYVVRHFTLLLLRPGRISSDDPEHGSHRIADVRVGRLPIHQLDDRDPERPDVGGRSVADTGDDLSSSHTCD